MAIVLPVSMRQAIESGKTFFIELYTIELRTGILRLAATDEDVVFNGQKYISVPIQRENITKSMDNITDSCTLTISDVDYGLLSYVVNGYDIRSCNTSVIRIQYPESLSDPSIFEWVYAGTLDEPSYSNGTFSCKINSVFPEIQVPNRSYKLACNSEFGDEQCGALLYTSYANVTARSGNIVYLDRTFSRNFFINGTISTDGESRIVVENDSNWVKLNVNFLAETITSVELNRGCNKTVNDCSRIGNRHRYSGFIAIPFENVYR